MYRSMHDLMQTLVCLTTAGGAGVSGGGGGGTLVARTTRLRLDTMVARCCIDDTFIIILEVLFWRTLVSLRTYGLVIWL